MNKKVNHKQSLEQLFIQAKNGDAEAHTCLANILMSQARGMAFNIKAECPYNLDFDEMIGIAHECFMRLMESYKPGNKRVLSYFCTLYARDLHRYINKKRAESLLITQYFDANVRNCEKETYHDLIGSFEDNPTDLMSLAETRLVLSDIHRYRDERASEQRNILLLLIEGYTIKEIGNMMSKSQSTIRRILNNKTEGMPLNDLLIRLGKDK